LDVRRRILSFGLRQFGFGLNAAVAPDVKHGHTARGQHTPYQQSAVTLVRVLFIAHERDTMFPNPAQKPLNALLELR
jgi:hypothetical protein